MRYLISPIRFVLCILLLTLPIACGLSGPASPESRKKADSHDSEIGEEQAFLLNLDEANATDSIAVRIGNKSQTFTLTELKTFPRTTIADYETAGVKIGPLESSTWTGASLKDILLRVESALSDSSNDGKLVIITSSDKWTAVIKWAEIFGTPRGGEALYNIKGCNECHGVNGEGTSPDGKRPAPTLTGQDWNYSTVKNVIRAGKDVHAGINPYTETQLSDTALREILDWLRKPDAPVPIDGFTVDHSRMITLLAYEKDGKAITGREGLIQMIVGMDEFAGRYSRWVETIEVR